MELDTNKECSHSVYFDLGTFEGFNFRNQSAICVNLTTVEVVNYDHDKDGEAEFWPSGDNPGVQLIFKGNNNVTSSELIALDRLLHELGGDTDENFLKIYCAVNIEGCDLCSVTAEGIEDNPAHFFIGDCFRDVRKEAAYELFELYYPEAYEAWEDSLCDGLIFDEDRFLDSPSFSTDEVKLGEKVVLIVTAN